MAALVKCDICGEVVPHHKARHVRMYRMDDATSFISNDIEAAFDVCSTCAASLKTIIKESGVSKRGNKRTSD